MPPKRKAGALLEAAAAAGAAAFDDVGLREAFGEAVHFIRFNPDLYKSIQSRKRTNKVLLDKRHEQLFDVLQNILSNPEAFFARFPTLSVSYMYYDDCDTPASWQSNAIVY